MSGVELLTGQGAGSIPGLAGPPRPARVDREPSARSLTLSFAWRVWGIRVGGRFLRTVTTGH